jgi:adenosylcobyric acid synthase
LQSGIDWLEEYTGIPVIGVIPYLDIAFPAEDSVSLFERRSRLTSAEIEIAVLRLPRISNFTDFDPLIAEPTVDVRYVMPQESLSKPDAVILPGSKTTINDLLVLQEAGMLDRLQDYVRAGGTIVGICGGMQMLGQAIADPDGKEGQPGTYRGLGMLPISTTITDAKILRQRQVSCRYLCEGTNVSGYEIHQGVSNISDCLDRTSPLFDDPDLGMVAPNRQIWGTYLHGLFDNSKWRRSWLNLLREKKGLVHLPTEVSDYQIQRDCIFDRLAEAIAPHLNLEILQIKV